MCTVISFNICWIKKKNHNMLVAYLKCLKKKLLTQDKGNKPSTGNKRTAFWSYSTMLTSMMLPFGIHMKRQRLDCRPTTRFPENQIQSTSNYIFKKSLTLLCTYIKITGDRFLHYLSLEDTSSNATCGFPVNSKTSLPVSPIHSLNLL